MTQPCLTCRKRKVKCDGVSPICGSCSRSKRLNLSCVYSSSVGRLPHLRRGNACSTCQRKKRRCDGLKPHCTTCRTHNEDDKCIYKNHSSHKISPQHDRTISLVPHQIFPSTNTSRELALLHSNSTPSLVPHRISPSPNASQELALLHSNSTPSMAGVSSAFCFINPILVKNIDDNSPLAQCQTTPNNLNTLPSCQSGIADVEDTNDLPLSSISMDDLDMSFRFTFLSHAVHFCIYFPLFKQQAIFLGDTSQVFIHPFFIHFAHFFGCHLWQEQHRNFCLLHVEALHLHLAYKSLAGMNEEDDPFSYAQAFGCLAIGNLWCFDTRDGLHCLRKAVDCVQRHSIRFFPAIDQDNIFSVNLGFSEEVQERATLLTTLATTETLVRLCIEVSGDELCFDIKQQFLGLSGTYPMFDVCPSTLKLKSLMLIEEAKSHFYAFQKSSIFLWKSLCEVFLPSFESHIVGVKSCFAEAAEKGDHVSSLDLQTNMIVCYASIAELYDCLMKSSEFSTVASLEYRAKRKDALTEVVIRSQGLKERDYHFLDPFVKISWTSVITLLKEDLLTQSYVDPSSISIFTAPVDAQIVAIADCKSKLDNSIQLYPGGFQLLCSALLRESFIHETPNFLLDEIRMAHGL